MVRTGDQPVVRVSRHIAPCMISLGWIVVELSRTYCLARDVWMPYLCGEFHDRGLEWVFIGDFDVDFIGAAFVWCSWWTRK